MQKQEEIEKEKYQESVRQMRNEENKEMLKAYR